MKSLYRSYHSLSLFLVQVTFAFLCRQQKDNMYIFKYFTKLRSYCSNSSSLEGTGCYYSSISLNSFPLEITNLLVSSLSLFFFFLSWVWGAVSSWNVTSLRLSRLSQLDSACELIKIGESIAN